MNRKVPFFLLLLVVSVCAWAEDFPPPDVVFDATLSCESIRSGDPVSIIVKLRRQSGAIQSCTAHFFVHPDWGCDLKITLLDEQKKACGGERTWPVWPFRQHFSNWITLTEGQFDIPLHMRCTTELPSGRYLVKCSLPSVKIRRKAADGAALPEVTGNVELPALGLQIGTADAACTARSYNELLEKALSLQTAYNAAHAGSLGDWMDYVPELRRLMWAWGTAAVPAQLRAIHDGRMFPFNSTFTFFAYQNILEHPSVEAVEELIALAKNGSFVQSTWWSGSYDPNLVWVLDELRKKGEKRFVDLIDPVLARFTTPIDLHALEKSD